MPPTPPKTKPTVVSIPTWVQFTFPFWRFWVTIDVPLARVALTAPATKKLAVPAVAIVSAMPPIMSAPPRMYSQLLLSQLLVCSSMLFWRVLL